MDRVLRAARTGKGGLVFGRGLIASQIRGSAKSLGRRLVFASGVSNSAETSSAAFLREHKLLTSAIRSRRKIIYFGSIGAAPMAARRYYRHKWQVERRLLALSKKHRIVNVPQVFGEGGNENSLVNYFYESIMGKRNIVLQSGAFRFLLPVKALTWAFEHPKKNRYSRSISLIHNAPITPVTLLAILSSEINQEEPSPEVKDLFTGFIKLLMSQRAKGRKVFKIPFLGYEGIKKELSLYVRNKKNRSGNCYPGL